MCIGQHFFENLLWGKILLWGGKVALRRRGGEFARRSNVSLGRKVWGGKFTLRGEFTLGRKVWRGKFTLRGEFARGRKVCSEAEN